GNSADHSLAAFYGNESLYGTWTKNTADKTAFGFLVIHPTAGDHNNGNNQVITRNTATNSGIGFVTERLDSSEDTEQLGSTIAWNTATNDGDGFIDMRTYISSWTNNNANKNGDIGFVFDFAGRDTVGGAPGAGNTASKNVDDGFLFVDVDAGTCVGG